MKNIIGNVEYKFQVFHFLQDQTCLRAEEGHVKHLL